MRKAKGSLLELADVTDISPPPDRPVFPEKPPENPIREVWRKKLSRFEPDADKVNWMLIQLDQADFYGGDTDTRMTIPIAVVIGLLGAIKE